MNPSFLLLAFTLSCLAPASSSVVPRDGASAAPADSAIVDQLASSDASSSNLQQQSESIARPAVLMVAEAPEEAEHNENPAAEQDPTAENAIPVVVVQQDPDGAGQQQPDPSSSTGDLKGSESILKLLFKKLLFGGHGHGGYGYGYGYGHGHGYGHGGYGYGYHYGGGRGFHHGGGYHGGYFGGGYGHHHHHHYRR